MRRESRLSRFREWAGGALVSAGLLLLGLTHEEVERVGRAYPREEDDDGGRGDVPFAAASTARARAMVDEGLAPRASRPPEPAERPAAGSVAARRGAG